MPETALPDCLSAIETFPLTLKVSFINEAALVQHLQNKDHAAFEYLYDHYAAALYAVIIKIVQDRSLCKDVLQEVFLKIWRQAGTYDQKKGSLYTWMYRTATNHCIDTIKSKAYLKWKINSDLCQTVETNTIVPDTDGIGLKKLVSRLPRHLRTIIWMFYFEGYTDGEIATMLKMPLGTVKTHKRKGMGKIKLLMKRSSIDLSKY